MTGAESFKRFGTISLGSDFIKSLIGFGELDVNENNHVFINVNKSKHLLQLGLWLEFVPEAFKAAAIGAAERALDKCKNTKIDSHSITTFINYFMCEVMEAVENMELTRSGWVKRDAPINRDLDHPCRQSCSGWQQGYERGAKDFHGLRAENADLREQLKAVKEALKL